MDPRYTDKRIVQIWSDENKLQLWQTTELAVLRARANNDKLNREDFQTMAEILRSHPIDLDFWHNKDKEIGHDLNAFLEERTRHLPGNLRRFFHKDMTSYDTEEPAFSTMLKESARLVIGELDILLNILLEKAEEYRYTLKMARTHGQMAELHTLGQMFLCWYQDIKICLSIIDWAESWLRFSKLSGAVGNYTGISPELEKSALAIMGKEPWYGATQIMPRHHFSSLAMGLATNALVLDKLATEFRLGARNPYPLWQEPFGKKQKGSSAMPHKKNTIGTEKVEGMARMAKGFLIMVADNIRTWEERAIEQSCVERVAWPDLFHVTLHGLTVMQKIIKDMRIYPENMLREIVESRGTYATSEAKEVLAELLDPVGLEREDAYRILQLAAFNIFESPAELQPFHDQLPVSLAEAGENLEMFGQAEFSKSQTLFEVITNGTLRVSDQLDADQAKVETWNRFLWGVFGKKENQKRFKAVFSPAYLLRHEATLYEEILA